MNFFYGAVVKPKQKGGTVTGVVFYINNKYFIKVKGRLHKFKTIDIEHHKVLYALPNNDKYEAWTEKHISSEHEFWNKETVEKYWGIYKPKMKLKGFIDDDLLFNVVEI